MIWGEVFAFVLLAVAVGIMFVWGVLKAREPDPLMRRRVVVHTKDDQSIRGVLTATHRDCFVLAQPEYLQQAQPEHLPGEVLVLRSNVSWIQILGGE